MRALIFLAVLLLGVPAAAQTDWAARLTEGDVTLRNFRFRSGETLPELRMHYATLGTPQRDAAGNVTNAVMVLHGTGGSGRQFLSPQFADQLYGPGQPLDITRYFIILPDNIGHGRSSKPSDGLRTRFPHYDYDDMVEAQRRMLAELGVRQLRLVMGTSMGCMHIFVWAEAHPDFARAAMPMACLPTEIAGHNRMWRRMAAEGIRQDPAWNDGNYTNQPVQGLRTAVSILQIAGMNPLQLQVAYPTRDAAEAYIDERVTRDIASRDANDLIYQLDSSRTYNPLPDLERIRVPMTWVNSADDFINPPAYGIAEAAARRMPSARYVLIPASAETRGHGTHTWARFWRQELIDLLARTGR
ncbi:alpha/beta fold hydrolase [Sphingosinicella sp. LHD-64]|uniref:alpha/beta fold hydrolase n=1 Tax=Sphingosinicella sp. LHD-64 TaxID=3072139 RepID=UPI0028106FDE|nr:alpha/beta fold hydrolase [Sphingosinicella sp. LHD-64]MDQ8755808.1 alpha/beta fold hydrolase [Sphingosinicella sp. LHD-64]